MSCTSRVDPETPADFLMSDLTEQDEILTRYSSHDLQEDYKLTHIERDDISIASDTSSDFELYGKEKSDDDDKESSADKEEIEYTDYDAFAPATTMTKSPRHRIRKAEAGVTMKRCVREQLRVRSNVTIMLEAVWIIEAVCCRTICSTAKSRSLRPSEGLT